MKTSSTRSFSAVARPLSVALTALAWLTGCVTIKEYSFELDYSSGKLIRGYHDLRSQKDSDDDYSLEKDWASLKEQMDDDKPTYEPAVARDLSKELFEEEGLLSARTTHQVACPQCFPSKTALLAWLHDDDAWRFEEINDEIFLILAGRKKVLSTNGQILESARNTMIVWPAEAEHFAYRVEDESSGGESLLPLYLKEEAAQPEKPLQ